MIWQRFVQIVAKIPADAQSVSDQAHEVPFGAYAFKEHHQLQFEEDDGIDAGTAVGGIATLNPLPNNREIERLLQVTIEMVARDQVL